MNDEIKVSQTPIYKRGSAKTERPISEEPVTVMRRIESIEKTMSEMSISQTNYNTHYFIDTSSIVRRKIDIIKDIGVPATELYVLSEGGGFTIEINDEGYAITVRTGFKVINEHIERIYVTGLGIAGTGRIRIGAWR